jgi:hypothetical protein
VPLFLAAELPAQLGQQFQPQPWQQYQQQPWQQQFGPVGVPVFRVNNPRTGEHRFTDDAGEQNGWLSRGRFQDEGVVFRLLPEEGPSLAPLYRLALPNGSTALGIMTVPGFVDPRGPIDRTLGLLSITRRTGWVSLYEWYNPRQGLWFYTIDPRGEDAAANGYRYVRIVGYVLPPS